MSEIAMKITGEDKNAQAALARMEAKVLSLESKIKGLGTSSRKSSEDTSTSILGLAAGYLSVGAAIGAVTKALGAASAAHEQWIANTREAIGVADKLVPALKPLLSGSGRQATEETMKIIAESGVSDRPFWLGFADKLEDAMGGDTKGRDRELKEVLDVFRLGDLSKEGLAEVGTTAPGLGKDVGQTIRQLHLVSQRYKVSEEVMNKALAMQERIGTQEESFAFAAAMQSKLPGRKAIGGMEDVLGAVGPDADAKMQKQFRRVAGVKPGQTFFEQLKLFGKAGQDTMEEFEKMGAPRPVAQKLAWMVQELPKMLAVIAELGGPAATEGAVLGQIAKMEAETPAVREAREREMLAGLDEKERIFGPMAREQAAEDARRQIVGGALRKMGMEQYLGRDFIDAEGRAIEGNLLTWGARQLAGVGDPGTDIGQNNRTPGGVVGPPDAWPQQRFNAFVIEAAQKLETAAAHLENSTRNMNGGAALVPRGEDK